MATTIHVSGVSPETSEKEIRDFFSFCGRISDLSLKQDGTGQSASVTFEKESASRTALLLDGTQLGKSTVHVEAAKSLGEIAGGSSADEKHEGEEIDQESKPRSRIFAEVLANGYVLSDQAIQKAIQLDNQHGISSKFTNYLTQLDSKTKATERAVQADQKYGITDTANKYFSGAYSYFEKALGTQTGQKLHSFYLSGQKTALDVHNEAKRLAALKTGKSGETDADGVYKPVEIPGSNGATHCGCGGEDKVCGCASGSCNCAGCDRATGGDGTTATGNADKVAADSKIAPLA